MALTDENGMVMPVAPVNNGGGFGFGGDSGWWIILLFVLLGGWGNGFGGYGNNGTGFVDATVQRGFDQNALMGGLNSINDAVTNGFFGLQSQMANCCCENRLASADLKYTIATENCMDRQSLAEGVQAILTNQSLGIQRILDQMCSDKIDAKNAEIMALERQLAMANLQASQVAQTAEIISKLPTTTTA